MAAENGPNTWLPAIYVGDTDVVLGIRCWPEPALAVADIEESEPLCGIYLFVSFLLTSTLPFKDINKSF